MIHHVPTTSFTVTVPPPNTADLGTDERAAVFVNCVIGGGGLIYY